VLFTINYCGDKIKKEELVKSSGETESHIQSTSWGRQHGRLNNKCKQAHYENGKYREGVRVLTTLTGFGSGQGAGVYSCENYYKHYKFLDQLGD